MVAAVTANATCFSVSPWAQVEGLRVFRTVLDLRSEKLLYCLQSANTELCTIIALDFVCQNRNPWSCSGQFNPRNGVLIMFPTAVIVHFLGNCEVITGCFFILIFLEKIGRCEDDGLSSLLALFSPCNESGLKDGLNAEGTTPVKYKLFPIVRN